MVHDPPDPGFSHKDICGGQMATGKHFAANDHARPIESNGPGVDALNGRVLRRTQNIAPALQNRVPSKDGGGTGMQAGNGVFRSPDCPHRFQVGGIEGVIKSFVG